MNSRTTLTFIEHPHQIADLLTNSRPAELGKIIALTPHAEYALERLGIAYATPEEFYDTRALEEFGISNFNRVEEFCQFVDGACQAHLPFFRRHELRPAWAHFYSLKILFDAATTRLFALRAIFEQEKPAMVRFYADPPRKFDIRLSWNQESIYGNLLRETCRQLGIETDCLVTAAPAADSSPHAVQGTRFIKRIATGFKARLTRSRGWAGGVLQVWVQFDKSVRDLCQLLIHGVIHHAGRRTPVLFCSSSYSLSWLLRHCQRSGDFLPWVCRPGSACIRMAGGPGHLHFLPASQASSQAYEELWRHLQSQSTLREYFVHHGIDWVELVRERLGYFFTQGLPLAERIFAHTEQVLENVKPAACLFSCIPDFPAKIAIQAIRHHGIPVISAMHGAASAYYLPMHAYTDFLGVDYDFVFGPGVANYVRKYYASEAEPIVTGSPMFESLPERVPCREQLCRKLGLDARRKIVLYVVTSFDGNGRYLSYRTPSDSELFRIQRRIALVFKNQPQVQLVIKAQSPDFEPPPLIHMVLRDAGVTNAKVIHEVPFERLIQLADLFIVDHPLTTLLQMLTTDTPIYIYNNWLKWEEPALEKLRKRASIYFELDEFCRQLDSDLHTGRCFEKIRTDEAFLRDYAIPRLERSSVNTMASALTQIILKRSTANTCRPPLAEAREDVSRLAQPSDVPPC